MTDDAHFPPDASETNPQKDWSYVSEGGASIVFSYVGPSNPTFNGTVLRLRKCPRPNTLSDEHILLDMKDAVVDAEPEDPSIAFQDVVTSKLVPSAHLPRLQTVKVSSPWLKELSEATQAYRPATRIAKDGIDVSRSNAVLATDLVGGKGWAVEIKPKWGFLPSPVHLSAATQPLKTRHCRFCMHSYLKGKKDDTVAGNYCPLDLFSGDRKRVIKALETLWGAWVASQGMVNNLRLFVEGRIIDPGDLSSYSRLATQFSSPQFNTSSLSELFPLFTEALLPLLMDTPLLSRLSHLQRTLDPLDIEGLSQLWSRSHSNVPLGEGEPEPSLEEWNEFVQAYLSDPLPQGEESLRCHILSYLLSATFKDCSIILRLGRTPGKVDGAGRVGDTVTAIDLDPKSVNRLIKWEALDQEIGQSFGDVAAGRVACIDAPR